MERAGKIIEIKRDAMRLLSQCSAFDDTRIFCELRQKLQLARIRDITGNGAGKVERRDVEARESVCGLPEPAYRSS